MSQETVGYPSSVSRDVIYRQGVLHRREERIGLAHSHGASSFTWCGLEAGDNLSLHEQRAECLSEMRLIRRLSEADPAAVSPWIISYSNRASSFFRS